MTAMTAVPEESVPPMPPMAVPELTKPPVTQQRARGAVLLNVTNGEVRFRHCSKWHIVGPGVLYHDPEDWSVVEAGARDCQARGLVKVMPSEATGRITPEHVETSRIAGLEAWHMQLLEDYINAHAVVVQRRALEAPLYPQEDVRPLVRAKLFWCQEQLGLEHSLPITSDFVDDSVRAMRASALGATESAHVVEADNNALRARIAELESRMDALLTVAEEATAKTAKKGK